MARKRKRPESPAAVLEMTPMIDVVFQLLIYFVVTIQPIDVITNLDVFRPAPDPNAKPNESPQPKVIVGVYANGYGFGEQQARVDLAELDRRLARTASLNANQTVTFNVSANSKHSQLVEALNICAKNGLRSLAIISAQN